MKGIFLSIVIIFSFTSFTPKKSLFCACCADNGYYNVTNEVMDDFMLNIMKEIKFNPNTELYPMTDDEGLGGLKSIEAGYKANDKKTNRYYFKITEKFVDGVWQIKFNTTNGNTGSLNLPTRNNIVRSNIDIHDTPEGNEVVLYKELRFTGTVENGDGFFKSSLNKPATYFLVLQGRGNLCDNASDFKYWRLEISGETANYTFFGNLN